MRKNPPLGLIVTCEHGGNRVPAKYGSLFKGHSRVLESHRAYDRGALKIARHIAEGLGAEFFYSTVTRLLVDLNRSLHNRALFSEFARGLPADQRNDLLIKYYSPFRDAVNGFVDDALRRGETIMLFSMHTFTPANNGMVRNADIGLLYDPARTREVRLSACLKQVLQGMFRVRMNYPYRGVSDGLASGLRRRLSGNSYSGMEIEINQRLLQSRGACNRAGDALSVAISECLNNY